MSDAWYEGLSDDDFKSETAKEYEKASAKIREGLAAGLDFDTACAAIDVKDEELRKSIIDDMLKVLIAEEHFGKNVRLDELAKKLNVPFERLEAAKTAMLEDVRDTSIKAFYKSLGHGNA
jgi:deoxyhypusine synthase